MGDTPTVRAERPGPRRRRRPATLALVAALVPLLATVAAAQSAKRWTCVLPGTGEQRVIDLEYATADAVPCLALDRQAGGVRTLADYRGTRGQCESIVDRVIATLGRAGYRCSGPVDLSAAPPAAPEPPEAPAAPEPRPPEPEASTAPSPPVEEPSAEPPPAADAAAGRTEPVVARSLRPPPAAAAEGGHFAIASTHMVADLAQKAMAELRLLDPFLQARVLPPRSDVPYWSVALAADAPRTDAEQMVVFARTAALGRLPFVWSFPPDLPEDRRAWIAAPDEWQPVVIRACREDGAGTVRAMAACAGLDVPPETFARCMAGSVCQPDPIAADRIASLDDRPLPALADIPADAPYVAPMLATPAAARACAVSAGGASAFAACMTAAMMSPGQREVHACHGATPDPADRAACAGPDAVPEERIVAACLDAGRRDPYALASCAGGRLTGRELARCASLGGDPAACFGATGMVAPALRAIARDLGGVRADGAGALRAAIEAAAAELEAGTGDAAAVRLRLRDLGNDIRRVVEDARILAAFDTVAPRLPER